MRPNTHRLKKIFSFRGFTTIVQVMIWIVDFLVPKNPNLWVFAIGPNKHWDGNLRALYEYASKVKNIRPMILIANPESDLPQVKNENIVYAKGFKGLWLLLSASTIIIQYHCHDFVWKGITNRNHFIVDLWHGMPVKGVGFTGAKGYSMRELKFYEKEALNYDVMISSSKIDRLAMSASFHIPFYKVWVTGLPRNDWLLQKSQQLPRDLCEAEQALKCQLDGRQLVLYAPTFRKNNSGFYRFSSAEAEELASFLSKNNVVMGFRPHICDRVWPFLLEKPEFLDLGADIYNETQVLLRLTDVLITDYSSIWLDFLLLGRPIIAFIYDWNEYKEDRGLIYDYEQIFPGPQIHKFSELTPALKKALKDGMSEFFKRKYRNALSMFYAYKDGRASERTVHRILERGKR